MSVEALNLPLDRMPDPLPIPVIGRPFDVTITPPGSKSLTNRALLLAALADGTSTLRNALVDADDARVMVRALKLLGARIEQGDGGVGGEPTTLRVTGVNGRWKIAPGGSEVRLDLHNAGTATRFLAAAAILAPDGTSVVIDGDARMRERPIGELVDALRSMGVRVDHLGKDGCPPLRVHAAGETIKDVVEFGRTASSQFISALLLIAPNLARGLRVRCRGDLTSPDYVYMTTSMLHAWGAAGAPGQASCSAAEEGLVLDWRIGPGVLKGREYTIEPDASGATYFEAAAALVPGARVTLPGLPASPGSMQGDIKFANVLEEAGAEYSGDPDRSMVFRGGTAIRPFDWDFSTIPDTAMTGAVVACFASPTSDNPRATSTLRGLRTLRVKETDRLEALRTELSKIGAHVEIFRDGGDEGLRITPPRVGESGMAAGAPPVSFDTYNDHRMAMGLALVGLRRANVSIRNPACVAKTYPTFWRDFARLYG